MIKLAAISLVIQVCTLIFFAASAKVSYPEYATNQNMQKDPDFCPNIACSEETDTCCNEALP